MIMVHDLVHKLIESKIRIEGYSTEDESNLNIVLTKIISNPRFHHEYKDLAVLMSSEIMKPSRRFKHIDINKLNIFSKHRRTQV